MLELSDSLDLSLFGIGSAKTFQELEAEIAAGESTIVWEGDRPIRQVQIACVQVRSPDGRTLIEDRQEFTDGRVRRRGLEGVSEKLQTGETPMDAAQRALMEELGIQAVLIIEPMGETVEERFSPSYPGLLSRYWKYRFCTVLPQECYRDTYVEEQASKKTFFTWK